MPTGHSFRAEFPHLIRSELRICRNEHANLVPFEQTSIGRYNLASVVVMDDLNGPKLGASEFKATISVDGLNVKAGGEVGNVTLNGAHTAVQR